MNYKDYYARQAGGALPYFAGAPYQRGHGLGSLFGGLLRSAMPLIKRGAVALGKGALKTGVRIADYVLSGQSIKRAAKRRVTDTGKTMLRDILIPGVRSRKRIKHTSTKKGGTTATRQRKRQTFKKREADIFDDSEQHNRQSHSRTSTHGFSGLGWTDRIPDTRIGRRLPRSRQHDATRACEGDASQRGRSPLGPSRGTSE